LYFTTKYILAKAITIEPNWTEATIWGDVIAIEPYTNTPRVYGLHATGRHKI